MRRISISADEDYVDRVDDRRESTTSRAQWFRGAGWMREEIEDAVDATGMRAELDDGWWRDELYDIVRERLEQRRERERTNDEQEIEA